MKPTHHFKITEKDIELDIGFTVKIMIRVPEKAHIIQKQKLRGWFRDSMYIIEKEVNDFMGRNFKLPGEII